VCAAARIDCQTAGLPGPRSRAAAAALGVTDLGRQLGDPQHMVGDHPAVRQVDVVFKLNGDHFRINLNHYALEPVADALSGTVVVAEYIDVVTYLVGLVAVWSGCKMKLCQRHLLCKKL
jgi:hypothetical protein